MPLPLQHRRPTIRPQFATHHGRARNIVELVPPRLLVGPPHPDTMPVVTPPPRTGTNGRTLGHNYHPPIHYDLCHLPRWHRPQILRAQRHLPKWERRVGTFRSPRFCTRGVHRHICRPDHNRRRTPAAAPRRRWGSHHGGRGGPHRWIGRWERCGANQYGPTQTGS